MTDWLAESGKIYGEITALYEDLHRHPELGNQEYRTTEIIENYLRECGIQTFRVLETGVIGYLPDPEGSESEGNFCPDMPAEFASPSKRLQQPVSGRLSGKGRTVAFRSDIDALPVKEETGLPYASESAGVMHACGHDIHMASLLGAAKILSRNRDAWQGNAVFIFQPDEEGDGGAERILETGILDRLQVDAVFGAHCNPELLPGTVGIRYGRFYASACKFDVTVRGKGTHGAEPEKGTDSVYAAARMCARLKELTGSYDGERAVVTVGAFHAGTARNIIPDHAEFSGILRTAGIGLRDRIKTEITQIVREIDRDTGTRSEFHLVDGYVGVTNHDAETKVVQLAAEELLGKDHVAIETEATMTTEDFGFYLLRYPGSYYHIGVGAEYPLHSPKMCPDEKVLRVAPAVHAAVMAKYCESPRPSTRR